MTLSWDANSPAPNGYMVFARRSDQDYDYSSPDWQGTATTCTISNLENQTDYYFVVRAYDGSTESADSNEVHYSPPTSTSSDTTPPSWNGATTGIGLAEDNGTGGSVNVEFDTAKDAVDGTNLKYNVYYAPTSSWNGSNWDADKVVANAAVHPGSTFANAVTITGLSNNVSYTFGVRAEDQSGNEDTNTNTLKATPTLVQTQSTYNLMLSYSANRSGAVYLNNASVEGNIYVFVSPTTNVQQVKFYIDGALHQTENLAPFDLAGTGSSGANPFNANDLSDGYHTFSAQVIKTDGSSESISASAYVDTASVGSTTTATSGNSYSLMLSYAANRSGAVSLNNADVEGNIYVFVSPTTDVQQVKFYIDGTLRQTENLAPFDLAGTGSSGANPFNADDLSDGQHAFSAQVIKTDGSTETISATVYVNATSGVSTSTATTAGTYTQWVSTSADRSSPIALDGSTLSNSVYVFVSPTTDIKSVQFYIDGTLHQTENLAPYDLAGTTNSGAAYPFDTHALSNGSHQFNARITKTDGSSETVSATVSVKN